MISMSLIFLILLFMAVMVVKFTKGLGKVVLGLLLGLSMMGTIFGAPAFDALQSTGGMLDNIAKSTEHGDGTVAPGGPSSVTRLGRLGGGHQ